MNRTMYMGIMRLSDEQWTFPVAIFLSSRLWRLNMKVYWLTTYEILPFNMDIQIIAAIIAPDLHNMYYVYLNPWKHLEQTFSLGLWVWLWAFRCLNILTTFSHFTMMRYDVTNQSIHYTCIDIEYKWRAVDEMSKRSRYSCYFIHL